MSVNPARVFKDASSSSLVLRKDVVTSVKVKSFRAPLQSLIYYTNLKTMEMSVTTGEKGGQSLSKSGSDDAFMVSEPSRKGSSKIFYKWDAV